MLKTKPVVSFYLLLFMTVLAGNGCRDTHTEISSDKGTFGYDVDFLRQHQDLIILSSPDNDNARIAVVAGYQGRVMTSTSNGDQGISYGWINYDLIKENTFQPHMNAFGGEDRFWLSPEGGQYSVYFEKGKPFDYENWQTPSVIDTAAYDIIEKTDSSATFYKNTSLTNYTGTQLDFAIKRNITVLSLSKIRKLPGMPDLSALNIIAYESVNSITNLGNDWTPETGMLGIWILGMFQPTPKTTIIVPFNKDKTINPELTADYFGEIPAERLQVSGNAVFLKADGNYRSKIGLSPASALPFAGSYDAGKGILTIVQFDLDPEANYLRSTWQLHDNPYGGDALNAYNDGPLEDGSQMGPFYELESSSPGKPLKSNETLTHTHRTFHFEGDPEALSKVSESLLGVRLDQL